MVKIQRKQLTPFLLFLLLLLGHGNILAQVASRAYFKMPEGITEKDYVERMVIFKMKVETDSFLKSQQADLTDLHQTINNIKAEGLTRMFPQHTPPVKSQSKSGLPLVDLSRIYYLTIPADISLEDAINRLYSTNMVEYAQPWYLPETMMQTDDPFTGSQYYLQKIKANDAWAVCTGDSSVIVAIIDTGIDLQHPDLINNVAYNYNDLVDNSDSDNDGYPDNYNGWDLADNDNNPQWDVNAHGVHVAGIAAASTNNGTGMAGVGFNSRLLPIKISDADGRLVRSYEGIVYAADRGARIINCSWGGPLSAGQFGQDIINYAVINRDAVVIAAAGNSNNHVRIYPASYDNVISVAATDLNDVKWTGSSYGKQVDLAAPGAGIFSTWPNGSYIASSGTSMAAPVVSGAAALLRSHFPSWSALQIAAQLKVTTDVIDTIAANKEFAGLLGTGRLNIHRALTETYHPFLLFTGLQYPGEYYRKINPGETFSLGAEFKNLLASSTELYAQISALSPYIEVISDNSALGEVEHNAVVNNFETPFIIKIKENIPASHEEIFTISFFTRDGTFAGQQNFPLTFNLDYTALQSPYLSTTINSKGNVGYNYPNYNQGEGLIFRNTNQNMSMLSCAGFIAANSTSKVTDNIYGPMENSFTNSFYSLINAHQVSEPDKGDEMIRGSFNDSLAGSFRIGLKVNYEIYTFNKSALEKFIIFEYDIINCSGINQPGFYAGFFADWVIQDVRNHRAAFDAANMMGYSFSANGGSMAGIKLLSHSNIRHYAFDNQGFGGSIKLQDGFTSFEKYTAMKSSRETAGFYDKDNDVSTLVSAGPFNLGPQDTIHVAFALLAGDHLNDLQANAQLASLVYNGDITSSKQFTLNDPAGLQVFPSPFNENIIAGFNLTHATKAEIIVFDLKAHKVYNYALQPEEAGDIRHFIDTSSWKPGVYILQLKTDSMVQSIKIIKN